MCIDLVFQTREILSEIKVVSNCYTDHKAVLVIFKKEDWECEVDGVKSKQKKRHTHKRVADMAGNISATSIPISAADNS